MTGKFTSPDGDLERLFVTDYQMIDQYAMTGTLWNVGYNLQGQLGVNDRTNRSSPVQTVAGSNNWSLVSSGSYYTAAIKTDGTLWLWGKNNYGQLGDNTVNNKSSPVQTIAGGTNWKQVSTSGNPSKGFTGAIKTDGTLWLWGNNQYGQMGNNNTGVYPTSPVQTISGGNNWKQLSCGHFNTAAIKTDGTLWLWGRNQYGQLGTNDQTDRSSPVQTIAGGTWKQVDCNSSMHVAAIKTDGTLWLWGRNGYNSLADGTTVSKSSPVQTVAGGTNWKQVSCSASGLTALTAAIKTDGTLWVWGRNNFGQLGDGTTVDNGSPVQTITGGTNWKQVSCYATATGAIKTDGTLWLWGYNNYGQLGTSNLTNYSSPVQTVAGGTNWKQVSVSTANFGAISFQY